MADLKALIEAVEAGKATMNQCAAAFPSESAYGHCTWHDVDKAYNGSMDAAIALFKKLLPDWDYRIESVGGKSKAFVSKPKAMSWNEPSTTAMSARALLLATLKAVEAQK